MKRKTQYDRILALLSDGKVHSYREVYALGVLASTRISVLRKKGHVIVCDRTGRDYTYQWLNP